MMGRKEQMGRDGGMVNKYSLGNTYIEVEHLASIFLRRDDVLFVSFHLASPFCPFRKPSIEVVNWESTLF